MTDDDRRAVDLEQTVEASPDEVWEALTTGPGLKRWFPLDARVQPGEEGSVWLSWGPGSEGEAPIHIWEPPTRFGWTESHGEDDEGRPIRIAVDFYVEGSGESTVVRIVQSGLSGSSDWDEMYAALEDGWTYFLFNLAFHFREHGGGGRTMVWRRQPTDLAREDAWTRLAEAGLVAASGAAHLELNGRHTTRPVSARERHHFAAVLPELNDSLWFVELEGRHVGFWLSVYDASGVDVDAFQATLDERAGTVLGADA